MRAPTAGVSGVQVQGDCLLPVSRDGRYIVSNVIPACASCKTSKWNSEVNTWIRHKHLAELGLVMRHTAIQEQMDQGFARRQAN